MTIQSSLNPDGTMTTSTRNHASSNDCQVQSQGIKVRNFSGSSYVADASKLSGDEIVEIGGMTLKASQAIELGLIGRVDDPSLSVSAASNGATPVEVIEPKVGTGNADYDEAVEHVSNAVKDGTLTAAEATVSETVMGELALSGLSVEKGIALINSVHNGDTDVPADKQRIAATIEAQVTTAATASAQAELGPEAFKYIMSATEVSPEVASAVRSYSIMRATGRADGLTWSTLYADIVAHVSGTP